MTYPKILRHLAVFTGDAQGEPKSRFGPFKIANYTRVVRWFVLFVLCVFTWGAVNSNASAADEEKLSALKAAFVYNFIKYVRWPETTEGDIIYVGILGDNPLAKPLREISEKRQVRGKRLEVKVFSDGKAIESCEILFVSADHVAELDTFRERLEASHVLLIGDTKGLVEKGVAINFVLAKERLRFEISQEALNRAKLEIGAQMLKLAILVDKKKTK
ncbi:MAG: hypothetical protein ACI8V2_001913 [Candidatus Latescibacterota bacterium]|jgi:hypothetical protein